VPSISFQGRLRQILANIAKFPRPLDQRPLATWCQGGRSGGPTLGAGGFQNRIPAHPQSPERHVCHASSQRTGNARAPPPPTRKCAIALRVGLRTRLPAIGASRRTPTCCATRAGISSPTMATTRERSKRIWGIAIFRIRRAIPRWRRSDSRNFFEIDQGECIWRWRETRAAVSRRLSQL
jgi:hypothetical protein